MACALCVRQAGKSFDTIPNFTASDVLRLLKIGRTEYITILNQARVRGWRWKVSKSKLRDHIPSRPPLDAHVEPYWLVVPHKLDPDALATLSCVV